MTALIVVLFLLGPVVVVPLLLQVVPAPIAPSAQRTLRLAGRIALPAGVGLAAAFAFPPGLVTGLLAVPWLVLAGLTTTTAVLDASRAARGGTLPRPGIGHAVWAALVFLAVAAANALADRLGIQPFSFSSTIILLTAVHFTFAGFTLTIIAALVFDRCPTRWLALAIGALVIGIPVTAVGFFGVPPAAGLGALLVAGGGFGVGAAILALARAGPSRVGRWFHRAAGLSLLGSMPLAAIYATGIWLGIP
ncbi:MAG: YndJ family transporter, partial [Candidatus Limnocylindrales bacterium]